MSKAQHAAEEMAESLMSARPPGIDYVIFVIADAGDQFETVLTASLLPSTFAPILRTWLARYDAGDAAEFSPDAR
jgi:hypothetical protein